MRRNVLRVAVIGRKRIVVVVVVAFFHGRRRRQRSADFPRWHILTKVAIVVANAVAAHILLHNHGFVPVDVVVVERLDARAWASGKKGRRFLLLEAF